MSGVNETLYVSTQLGIDYNNETFSFDNYDYNIAKADNDVLELEYNTTWNDDQDHQMKYVWSYVTEDKIFPDEENPRKFATKEEAYAYILRCARSVFGDEVNLNQVLGTMLDEPVVNIAELEQMLADGKLW